VVLRVLSLVLLLLSASGAFAQKPTEWIARYPLSPRHPAVAIGWRALHDALAPEIDLQLRLDGPRLGTAEALELLAGGRHQVGIVPLTSYPESFPYWSLIGELFLIGRDSLAAAAAVTELVMFDCPPCQENLARQKLVFLGTYGTAAYGLIAPWPLTEPLSLKGQVVSTPGSVWDRLVSELGGTPAGDEAIPRSDLVDGRVTALIDIPSALLDPELVKFTLAFTELPLGSYRGASPFTFNRNAWLDLSTAQRRQLFQAAAASIVRMTRAFQLQGENALTAALTLGAAKASGSVMLEDRIRRFATADMQAVVANSEERFGVRISSAFVDRLWSLYDKYATLAGPQKDEAAAIALLQSEIFDRLDANTYGLE
jgi:TRAP-type transport system periplasmic protein